MDNKTLIDQYEAGPAKLKEAIIGLSHDELLAAPIPGKWSTQQVVIHLADAEAAQADRMRRVLATDNPPLLAWDENQFAANLHYDVQSAEDAVQMIELTRRQLARILRASPASAFDRTGTHSERGKQTLRDILTMAVTHMDHHLKFVDEKRKALRK
jgi:uncharacterized damage-inducible protein DinB